MFSEVRHAKTKERKKTNNEIPLIISSIVELHKGSIYVCQDSRHKNDGSKRKRNLEHAILSDGTLIEHVLVIS